MIFMKTTSELLKSRRKPFQNLYHNYRYMRIIIAKLITPVGNNVISGDCIPRSLCSLLGSEEDRNVNAAEMSAQSLRKQPQTRIYIDSE